ncbi:protein TASOR 2 [Bufo bufo]|uniref:protein TASOR 2 n=1 Tax=Bufo bufo TaxID=8384 RepID=UPI001ABEB5E1|nr:protein TASOR 2 [Bufo bufo]
MLMLKDSDMIHLNTVAPYNAWRGQLYIHEQLVCSIALQAPSACSIPAQLSEKLDLKEVIQWSDLRKTLPEDIFQKTDPTGQEVSCGNIYYSLFSVVTSNIVGSDKLLKCLRDQDLALIKELKDQGFLILVNSTALQSNTGISDGNSAQLNALFLFPHQRFLDKRGGDEWESKFARKELSSTITNLLPGLHYAIIESRKLQKDKALYPGPLVEQYFRKHVVLQSKKGSSSERRPEQSVPLSVFNSHGDEPPTKCSQLAFSCLQLYVSSPVNFNIPVIRMSNIVAETAALSGNSDQSGKTIGNVIKQDNPSSTSKLSMPADSKATSSNPRRKRAVHEDRQQISKRGPKRKSAKRKKKSKPKSVHRAALSTAETSENQTSNKRKRLLSEDKKQIGSSSEVLVKLASAPYPQRRKRGAEVLTAAFIQDEKIQTTDKMATSKTNEENKNLTQKAKTIKRTPRKILAPEEPFLVPDRPSKRKVSDPGNKNMSVGATKKSVSLRRANEIEDGKTGRGVKRNQEKMKNVTVEQINTFSKSSESSAQVSEDSMIEKRIGMYESHALNLLADLALNSFGSTGIPYIKSGNVASANEPLIEEAASTGDSVSTVEPPPKGCSLPAQSTITITEVERILESEIDKPKNGLSVSPRNIASQKRFDNVEKQMSPKAHIAAAKAKARYNALSKICLEHSYSQLPMEDIPGKPAKQVNEQPIQGVPDSTTSADIVPPEPSANGLPEENLLLTNESVCPDAGQKQRAVSKFQDNVVVTFHWEPKYDFDVDSKFTRDPLEKTINRALHGPWNPNLKEKVEDVKIILHMWIALFYSKSSKPINFSSRKVVEHSNPAKYVSINTVLDPFEFYEIMELDDVPSAENSNVILPMGKRSELSGQVNPFDSVLSCRLGKSHSKSLQDVTVPPTSIPTKDYNIKLSSEIFQMCKDSESADCSDSLQTSMMGIMAPTSKGAPAPDNVMKTIFGANVPTVCYIGDTNLFNTELADKSENCMHIGGFSSEKAKPKDIEHKYSRHFSRMNEAQKSAGKQAHCKVVSSDADENSGNIKVSFSRRTSQTHSDILSLHEPPTTGESHETPSKSELAGHKGKYLSKSIPSLEIPSADDMREDITDENPATVELSPEKDELSVQSVSLLGARVPASVDSHKAAAETAESQDPLPAAVLPSQEINDLSANADAVLQNTERNDSRVTIPNSCDVMVVESPSDHNDVKAKFCTGISYDLVDPWMNREALECDKDSSGINHVGPDNLRLFETPDRNVHSESVQSDDVRQVGECTDTIASNRGSQKIEGLAFGHSPNHSKNIDSDMNVDCNSNCTEGGTSNSALDSIGLQDREEKAIENIFDEFENVVEPKNTHELDENVLNKITAADTMSRISDEGSDVDCSAKSCTMAHMESDELERKEKSLKEVSEKTEEKEGHSIGEDKISTTVEHSVPVVYKDHSVPEKENVEETDVHEPSHISEASMVEEPEKEVPEKGILTLNVSQNCLNDEDTQLFNEAATDEGTKEPEALNHDANMNIDSAGLLEFSKKEVPSTQEISAAGHALPYTDGACLVEDPSLVGAGGIASTSVLGDLDREVNCEKFTIEDSVQCENHKGHVHNEGLAESQSRQLLSQAPFEGDKTENNICLVETVNEKDDALLTIAETQTCQTVVNSSVTSGLSKDMLGGKSDVGNLNEKTLQTNIMDSTQQPLKEQSPDLAGDDVHLCSTVTPASTSGKDSKHSNRKSSKNKKEILSKLKRICLGSMTGHLVSSSCENVLLSQDENSIAGGFTKENENIDLAKNSLPGDEDKSILKNSDDVAEEPAIDNLSPEESAMTSVEPKILEGVKSSQDVYLISSSLEDVSDSIEQDLAPELPDICFIVNTGSISKEQYDRWSETSDEDIEYIRSYKEPLAHEDQLQKEIRESPSLFQDKVTCSQEQTTTDRTKKNFQLQSGSNSGLYETDEYFSRHLQDLESKSHTNRGNVNVTRNIKGHGRALRTVTEASSSMSDLDHLFSDRRMVSDDLTQNTLDMENVRFVCKLKDILRKSTTDKHIHGPPFQTMFESRRIPSCSQSTVKCRGPLLITMHCPRRRTDFRRHDSWHPSTCNSSPYYEDELWDRPVDRPVTSYRTKRKCRTPRYSPYHFSRLRYEHSLDKSNNDISVILNECVQSNHLKLSSIGLDSTAADRTSAIQLAEESDRPSRRPFVPVSSKSQSVKNLISDLCTNLHSRLQNVARASERKVSFYIYETDDGDFISSAKSLLVKDGHVETDPPAFLSSEHSDSHQLLVIMKNEDVFSCINKIPYLMQLKLLPNVTFAGVDTPEDITESTYGELFQAGGFVVSDKSVLGNITLGKLKEVLAVLEKMNRNATWKWLIHYRENRKLKDDKRAEPLSRTKMSLLKSHQYLNIIEMLPYHQCDSRSNEPSDDLSCLVNLQYQHIHSRLAVYLTGATSVVTEEYEQNGILVYDVDTFLRKIQKVDSQFQASYWP